MDISSLVVAHRRGGSQPAPVRGRGRSHAAVLLDAPRSARWLAHRRCQAGAGLASDPKSAVSDTWYLICAPRRTPWL